MGSKRRRRRAALQGGTYAHEAPRTTPKHTGREPGTARVSHVRERLRVRASELGPREAPITAKAFAPRADAEGWQHGAGHVREPRTTYWRRRSQGLEEQLSTRDAPFLQQEQVTHKTGGQRLCPRLLDLISMAQRGCLHGRAGLVKLC